MDFMEKLTNLLMRQRSITGVYRGLKKNRFYRTVAHLVLSGNISFGAVGNIFNNFLWYIPLAQ